MSLFSKLSKNNDKNLYPWSQKKLSGSNSALPRAGHAAVAISSDAVVIFGGAHKSNTKKELFYIDINTLTATSIHANGDIPSPRVLSTMVVLSGHIILYGGKSLSSEEMYDPGLYALNLHNKQWTRIHLEGAQPPGRFGHTSVTQNGIMYMFGGQKEETYFNDMYMLNSSTFSSTPHWEKVVYNSECPEPRSGHISALFENKLYIFGGRNDYTLFNDIWSFDLHTRLWSKIDAEGFTPTARESCASAMADDVIYIIGGRSENGTELNDLCAYKIKSRRWFRFQNMGPAPSPRHGLTMTAVKERLFVIGGDNETSKMDDASFIYILDSLKIKYPIDTPPPNENQQKHPQQQQRPYQQSPQMQQAYQQSPQLQQAYQQSPQLQQQLPYQQSPQMQQQQLPYQQSPQMQQQPRLNSPHSPIPQQRSVVNNIITSDMESIHSSATSSPVPKSPRQKLHYPEQTSQPPVRPPRHIPTASDNGSRRLRENSPLPVESDPPTKQTTEQTNMQLSPPPRPSRDNVGLKFTEEPSTHLHQEPPTRVQQDMPLSPMQQASEEALLHEIQARDHIIAEMKKKENWWRTEVSLARKQRNKETYDDGPEADEALLMDVDHLEEDKVKLFEQLVAVKSELRRVRAHVFQQAQPMSEKVAQADRMRTAALQEAAYFKSKYLALKSRRKDELNTIDSHRCDDLERRLAAVLIENEAKTKLLQQLQKQSQYDQTARVSTEERAREAHVRAEEAQEAHQRALEELQAVFARASRAEAHVRDNAIKIADLTQQLSEALAAPVKSQDVAEAQFKVAQLEAANLKARNETANLKQKLAEQMDAIVNLKTLLQEREDQVSEAKIHFEDYEIQLNMLKEAIQQQQESTINNSTKAY